MFFNPYTWGAIIGFCVLSGLGGYYQGWHARTVQAEADLTKAYQIAFKTQQDNEKHLHDTVTRYETQKKQIDASVQALRLDVNNAANRVYINTRLPAPDTATNVTNGTSNTTQCELDQQTATTLINIAADGDNAIAQLNALIDFYQGLKP